MIPSLIAMALLTIGVFGDGPRELRVGHWVEVRGAFDAEGRFVAQKISALPPSKLEVLIGTVSQRDVSGEGFVLLDQPISVSEKTDWSKVSLAKIGDARVKVEGYWRGPGKLSARAVKARGAGRDRLEGRIDRITEADGGRILRVMRYDVFVADDLELTTERPLAELELAPERVRASSSRLVDEDDLFGKGFALTDDLRLSGQLEGKATKEDEFDLDRSVDEDRSDLELNGRIRLTWQPRVSFQSVVDVRYRQLWRNDGKDGYSTPSNAKFGETFVRWSDLLGTSWGLRVGRQDFDDAREWLYDQNLDAVRAEGRAFGLPLELSLSTTLTDGSKRDKNALNAIAYLSNGNDDRHLAAWAIHRDFDLEQNERRTHFGLRAIGEWLPEHESWAEFAGMMGRRGGTDLLGWGYDIGTTWSPESLAPFSFSAGYALGFGGDPESSTDRTFRQSGLQDNNGKLGGVTSFRYYGELLDPELANLGIATLGAGVRLAPRTSLDLVFHHYRQDVVLPMLVDTNLGMDPDGAHASLGWEIDAVLGWRQLANWDLEIVGSMFRPEDAFPGADDAFLIKIQLRRRF